MSRKALYIIISILVVLLAIVGVIIGLLATGTVKLNSDSEDTAVEDADDDDSDTDDDTHADDEEEDTGDPDAENHGDFEYVITSPQPNETIASPFTVEGRISGGWFDEGIFNVVLRTSGGTKLADASADAQEDWMTDEMVAFEATLTFDSGSATTGKVILQKANPSGLPANDDSIEIPVRFEDTTPETMTVKVYFGSTIQDPEALDCTTVYSVNRTIPKTVAVGRASINELLEGVTAAEAANGFFSSINAGVILKSISISGGVAHVDFTAKLEEGVGGTCKIDRIRAQITKTLKQFPTVTSVEISIEGETEAILQP